MTVSRTLIRPAESTDVQDIASVLARAFTDDPFTRHVVHPSRFDKRITALFRSEARMGLNHTTVAIMDGDLVGAAIWRPPSPGRPGLSQAAAGLFDLFRGVGRGIPRAIRAYRALEEQHPKTPPHWYLQTIGAAKPGLGIGGALLRAGLERVDAAHMPAYLESSSPANVAIYEKFGFRVIGEIATPDDGPRVPTMWRDPMTDS